MEGSWIAVEWENEKGGHGRFKIGGLGGGNRLKETKNMDGSQRSKTLWYMCILVYSLKILQ